MSVALDYSSSPPRQSWRALAPVVIVLAVLLAYSNAYKGPFIYDDESAILLNPTIRTLWPIWVPMFPPGHYQTAGRPLVGLSFAINYALDGPNPRGYHAGNILLHSLSSLILLGVLRRTLRRIDHPQADGVAFAAALLWSVHPLLTDAVTYCADRSEVLMSFFFLLTFYAFLRSLESPRPRRWLAGAVASAFAATASKEVATMIPLVLLCFDVLIVTRSWKQTLRDRWGFYLALLICFVLLPITLAVGSFQKKAVVAQQVISPWRYLMMQAQVITRYLWLCFWPKPLVLSYVDWPIPASLAGVWPWLVWIGALFAATVYGVVRKARWGMIGAWCFLLLAPTSSLLVILAEPAAERRMYLPLAAVLLGLCVFVGWLIRRLPYRTVIGSGLVGFVALTLVTWTLERNEDYADVISIWADTVAKRPGNPAAHYGLGQELAKQGYLADALVRFDSAIKISPTYLEPRISRALVLAKLDRADEALAELKSCLRMDPDNPDTLTMLGATLHHSGNIAEAEKIWQQVLDRHPDSPEARRLLEESKRAGNQAP